MTLARFISSKISSCSPAPKGRDRIKVKVHVHINKRQEEVATHRELVTSTYGYMRPFVVAALTIDHLVAEKVRALLTPGKPRDLYDIWLLLGQGGEA
jgi:predicted nucleotidyltransferase component of viral defense system